MSHIRVLTAVCVLGFCAVAAGQEFHLRSRQTDRLYGPFVCRDGEEILVGKSAFTVVVEKPARPEKTSEDAEAEQAGLAAAEAWLSLVDGGEYDDAWESIANYLKSTVDRAEFLASLKTIRDTLGTVASRRIESVQATDSLPSAPDGKYVVIRYRTRLERKLEGVETVIPMLDGDGQWRVSGYDVR